MEATARAAARGLRPASPRLDPDLTVALVIVTWIGVILLVDHRVSVWGQAALGLGTWCVLVALLRRETRLTRIQVGVVIAFASLVEYIFSPVLDVYTYRLGGFFGVPTFVPPGHGLVYLAALCLARSSLFGRHERVLVGATVIGAGAYAAWGLWWSPQPDALGAFWYLCLLGFLAWGRMRLLYVGAFIVVTALELVGTRLGVWTWAATDPTGWVSIGNPPSVAAGGYGWFDLVAVTLAPTIALWLLRFTRGSTAATTAYSEERNAPSTESCTLPFVDTAQPADTADSLSNPEMRPPASSTTGTSAAISHIDNSGSTAMSSAPSATSTCDQKSP